MKLFLIISMIIAIVFAFGSGMFTLWKVNVLKKRAITNDVKNSYQNAWDNSEYGNLVTTLKDDTIKSLNDHSLIFVINTLFRNKYQTSWLINFENDYEKDNLTQIGKQTLNFDAFDFLLINANNLNLDHGIEALNQNLSKLNQGGMICLANIKSKSNLLKNLKEYAEANNLRSNFEKIGQGFFLIVK